MKHMCIYLSVWCGVVWCEYMWIWPNFFSVALCKVVVTTNQFEMCRTDGLFHIIRNWTIPCCTTLETRSVCMNVACFFLQTNEYLSLDFVWNKFIACKNHRLIRFWKTLRKFNQHCKRFKFKNWVIYEKKQELIKTQKYLGCSQKSVKIETNRNSSTTIKKKSLLKSFESRGKVIRRAVWTEKSCAWIKIWFEMELWNMTWIFVAAFDKMHIC